MVVTHRPGKKHIHADALSRIPDKPHCKEMIPGMDISKLPCDGCKYCTKAHQYWTVFAQEIDDIVPLGMSTHSEQLSETTNVYAAIFLRGYNGTLNNQTCIKRAPIVQRKCYL